MDKKQFAYSTFQIKAVDETKRIIQGIASTPSPDRMDDIVEPMGAQFKLPLPFLWQHDSRSPIGWVTQAKPNKKGIPVTIEVAQTDQPGALKDLLDMAWQAIKMELVRGLSIGFVPKADEAIDGSRWGRRFTAWDWLELSAVTIPANAEASITAIKSADQPARQAALGRMSSGGVVRVDGSTLGASSKAVSPSTTRSNAMKTTAEQIAAFEAKRAAAVARMKELMDKAGEEQRSLEQEESDEYEQLKAQVKSTDEHLVRLREHEEVMKAQAAPVSGGEPEAASRSRSGIITVRSNVAKGTAFTRYAMALARSKGNIMQAVEIAKQWKDTTPVVELALKAAVDPGNTTSADWAGPLVNIQQMADEFIELLRPSTIVGRISGFRRVPFNVKMPRQLTGSSAGWVGQAVPKPVGQLTFDSVQLGFAKCAGIVVVTDELARLSSPSAEAVVQQDMIEVISQFMDQQFIDPTVAAVANVSPASVTNGVTPRVSTGASVTQVQDDVKAIMNNYITANISLATGVWIMNPRTALALSMLRSSSQDTFAFPSITPQGGTFFGLPVITSSNVPVAAVTGGETETIIVLANANDILLADDGGIALDVSREASLQMDTAPETGAVSLVSLWQNNLVGLRAERAINWLKRRSAAVQYISEVTY